MKSPAWIKVTYWIAAFYDGLLGLIFLIGMGKIFAVAQVDPPNHPAYIQFPAMILIIFAYLFYNIARKPIENRNLIIYGVLIKLAYCASVIPHWVAGQMPSMWIPFAVFDFIFMLIFIYTVVVLKKLASQ